ncbi:MAG: alginate O-acetyltransferase AlgX-related protein [Solidesulfovibrio sp. DCME]|uniref:alginate O-acetyltransferase AlgX-related protein n=1 Tax=Solidesulfovibrio sp. DCME TaxID=3447380 RepID=UPI003D0DB36C
MKRRLLRLFGIVFLVAVQILAVCLVVDFFFRKYEKEHVYSYARPGAASYSLEAMLLNDHHDVVTRKKPAGEFRILAIGDSFTFSVTRPEFGLCAAIEKKLGALVPGRTVRVVNLGFPSISFPGYLERLYFWSQALEYDAVVFNVYLGNDFNDVRETPYDPAALNARLADLCRLGLAYGPYTLVPHQYPFRFMDFIKAQVLFKLQSDKELRRLLFLPDLETLGVLPDGADTRYRSLLPLSPAQMASERRSTMKPFFRDTLFAYQNDIPWYELLLATAARLREAGKPVLVMLAPPEAAVDPAIGRQAARDLGQAPEAFDLALPARLTRELARQVGLPQADILDLTPCLAGTTPDGHGTYSGRDTHWSPEGNAWVGDLVAKALAGRWFGQKGLEGACPEAAPAFEPLPAATLAPPTEVAAEAAAIVAGCPPR